MNRTSVLHQVSGPLCGSAPRRGIYAENPGGQRASCWRTPRCAPLLCVVFLLLSGCSPKPPMAKTGHTALPPTTAQPRLRRIAGASGAALCELVSTVNNQRDAAILGPVLDLAYGRRHSEPDRACFAALLTAMKANAHLVTVARAADSADRWFAILSWAGQNLRAKHFAIYSQALDRPETAVRVAAVAQLGRHTAGPRALVVLKKALADPAVAVRLKAVAAAAQMDHPATGRLLRARQQVEIDKTVLAALQRVLRR